MILQNLDTILAFVMIMLLLSMLATIAVQMIVSLLGLRGKNLLWGVDQLLQQVAPKHTETLEQDARKIAETILTYPALTPEKKLKPAGVKGRWGITAIRPQEVLLVLGKLRSSEDQAVKNALSRLLPESAGEIETESKSAAALVDKVKKHFPEHAAKLEALIDEAYGEAREVVESVGAWFEVVMDATAERFKLYSRWITVAVAILLAFGFQIDSLDILRQLSKKEVRTAVLAQVETVESLADTVLEDPADADAKGRVEDLRQALDQTRETLAATDVEIFAVRVHPFDREYWSDLYSRFGGITMTAFLLSLGAPFWYGAVKKLVGLRSVVAEKQEARAKAA